MELNQKYWEERYQKNETGWDVGEITKPLKTYFDSLKDKSISILIPGAGNAYEAEYLHNLGFKNITIVDLAPSALANIKKRIPNFDETHLICDDFFNHTTKYDLIVEQTFFCALNPSLREQYAKKMNELLTEKGLLVGVLFNDLLNRDKPPFGGNTEEYKSLFSKYFTIEKLEECYNSIAPRKGREVFIKFRKK
ncbi:MAG: methyltransferase domain-containing protein [Bacteroidota bacterium]